jgi:hypothetical protein
MAKKKKQSLWAACTKKCKRHPAVVRAEGDVLYRAHLQECRRLCIAGTLAPFKEDRSLGHGVETGSVRNGVSVPREGMFEGLGTTSGHRSPGFDIGEIVVVPADQKDPHEPLGVTGFERQRLLRKFRDGGDTVGWAFWHIPYRGRPRRLTDPTKVDWTGIRPKSDVLWPLRDLTEYIEADEGAKDKTTALANLREKLLQYARGLAPMGVQAYENAARRAGASSEEIQEQRAMVQRMLHSVDGLGFTPAEHEHQEQLAISRVNALTESASSSLSKGNCPMALSSIQAAFFDAGGVDAHARSAGEFSVQFSKLGRLADRFMEQCVRGGEGKGESLDGLGSLGLDYTLPSTE